MTAQTTAPAARTDVPATRRWPLYLIGAGAAVATWSGWVELGAMTGFGEVRPLPGIWDSLVVNTAITLPISVEAYGAYALQVWLSSANRSARTSAFAKWSSLASLGLGALGQVAYHLLAAAGASTAPGYVTVLVSCLPVLMLGLASALGHMVSSDTPDTAPDAAPDTAPVAAPAEAQDTAPDADESEDGPALFPVPVPAALADRRPGGKAEQFKRALTATGGDVNAAIEHMRDTGQEPPARGYAYRIRQTWQRSQAALA